MIFFNFCCLPDGDMAVLAGLVVAMVEFTNPGVAGRGIFMATLT